jgi:uncharacterized protein involved in exopolysaccharide biosynthesis
MATDPVIDSHNTREFERRVQDDVTLFDIALVLAKYKKLVIGFPILLTSVTLAVLLIIPNTYTAATRIVPPQRNESTAAALLGNMPSGIGIGGTLGSVLGLKNPNDLYVGILKSDTIADRLIERFKLQELYDERTKVDTRRTLAGVSSITAGTDGLIVIAVEDMDPKRAADIANAYVEELDRLVQQLAISEASRRRVFFERELKLAREKLTDAELALKGTQERTGLIQPEGQAKAIFDIYVETRARIAAKEVELASLRTFATDSNPDLMRVQQELSSLRAQASKLEKSQGVARQEGDILLPTGRVAAAGLDYVRRMRDVKYHEALLELLSKQFELAKIDEAKDALIVQMVDQAMPPDRHAKPRRGLLTTIAAVVSTAVAVLTAGVLEVFDRSMMDPVLAHKRAALLGYLRWRQQRL